MHSDFCLIPMNTPTPSVGAYIAACQRVLERYAKQDGFKYEVRAAVAGMRCVADAVRSADAVRRELEQQASREMPD
jgi:uncharacterized protein YqgV (UPF0045/DUF77 family)